MPLSCLVSFFIRSIHHFFGLPRGRFSSLLRHRALFSIDSSSLLTTWPYPRSYAFLIVSIIGATPVVFLTSSFFTSSHRVSPSVHLIICISFTWRACSTLRSIKGDWMDDCLIYLCLEVFGHAFIIIILGRRWLGAISARRRWLGTWHLGGCRQTYNLLQAYRRYWSN